MLINNIKYFNVIIFFDITCLKCIYYAGPDMTWTWSSLTVSPFTWHDWIHMLAQKLLAWNKWLLNNFRHSLKKEYLKTGLKSHISMSELTLISVSYSGQMMSLPLSKNLKGMCTHMHTSILFLTVSCKHDRNERKLKENCNYTFFIFIFLSTYVKDDNLNLILMGIFWNVFFFSMAKTADHVA